MRAIGRHVSKLTGYAPALPTPFDDNDCVDGEAFERICDLQIRNGATALVVCGTTGESPNLIDTEIRRALDAAGPTEIWDETDDTCHLNGTARMGTDPCTSVVNADCRSWDIPNLWICDSSVFPTVGGVNPSLTIQAIACRTADRIKALARRGEL
jgi:choline dehydrogenase-like flavoprotein